MNIELIASLGAFALLTTSSPGPNNLMLMASGANYGWRRSIPHIGGVIFGLSVMILLLGVGVEQLFQQFPAFNTVLKVFSAAFLLYLAWRVLNSQGGHLNATGSDRPMSFLQAALFQWINPKAWSMILAGLAMASSSQEINAIAWVVVIFALVNSLSANAWVCLGGRIVRLLHNDRNLAIFNYCVAGGLVLSILPVVLEG